MALGPLSGRDRQNRYTSGLLRYDEAQALSEVQQHQARANIGAAGTEAVTDSAAGLMPPTDKVALDAMANGTQTELNGETETAVRAWSAAMLGIWLQNRVRALFNVGGTAPMHAVRAWVTFNTAGTIVQAGNVSSVTRLGTGRWRVNFGTNMPVAGFAISGSATQDDGGNSAPVAVSTEIGSASASGVIVQARYATSGSQGLIDPGRVSIIVVC